MAERPEFNAIRISVASPEYIRSLSYGEVTKPETINYRTLRPEKDGLFCEKIFGPTKDWECSCGKYKKVRHRGVKCDRCGVEVTRAKVRRERMGHITLASPVAHIWFSKGVPSRLGLLLDLSPRNLERVLYFAQYIITSVHEDARHLHLKDLQETLEQGVERQERAIEERIAEVRSRFEAEIDGQEGDEAALEARRAEAEEEIARVRASQEEERKALEADIQARMDELEDLRPLQLLTETRFRELRDRCGDVFKAGMGAQAILAILQNMNLEETRAKLHEEVRSTSGQRRKKAIQRLRLAEAFRNSNNRPEWMVVSVLPVLPPDLRPMVQLDGGRFATSDLNDLYRRVINRNTRLKRLLELGAPEIIVRNEKRMLQEAVDALVDNGRRGRAISGSHNHKLKSLSDLLRGKQGRFRQNLLGKRVDYSGRSVIVVGPELQLHQCGLPKRMALELFKPFVMNKLVLQGYAHNIKSAKRIVERARPEVWDILEDVIKDRPVLLNRAPTLHRLGIQAFMPVLIEGNAIQIHPLVCAAFNADFDGDQMAVHVPLSRMAVQEARKIMLSSFNLLSPSSSDPIVAPTLDIVLGCYWLTIEKPGSRGEGQRFRDFDDVRLAVDFEQVDYQAKILVRDPSSPDRWLETTVGRALLRDVLPPELQADESVWNRPMDKGGIKDLVSHGYRTLGNERLAQVLDAVKDVGFHYASRSGITIAINDIEVAPEKASLLATADRKIELLEEQYGQGLITEEERYGQAVAMWTEISNQVERIIQERLPTYGGIYFMATSGAKGNIAQIKQMAGMRGLMSNPWGKIIELPVKASFREGLSVLEYFISTHGARKGLTDTALRTADSGYLTRRLIDVSQDVLITEDDCGTMEGIRVVDQPGETLLASFTERIVGRWAVEPVPQPQTGESIVDRNEEIGEGHAQAIKQAGVTEVVVRSPLTCEAQRGLCRFCYGRNPATGDLVMINSAVGIIAAQSIGEPGTQLTMRTFHTGGVAQAADITSGLPRVEELFEARSPRGKAILAEIDGQVELLEETPQRRVKVVNVEEYHEEYPLPPGYQPLVSDGEAVDVGTPLAHPPEESHRGEGEGEAQVPATTALVARVPGVVHLDNGRVIVAAEEREEREHVVPPAAHLVVEPGQSTKAGDPLTGGPRDPQEILRIQGAEEVQRYLVDEVQQVYRSQGVSINNKHIEVIVRQMLKRVRVDSPGDTELLPGELVERYVYEEANARVLAQGGEPATASPVLLGVTRASLQTDSFLAAASFQETTRVLTEAAIKGDVDRLRSLKENVIIGRLIPARYDTYEEGRKRLDLDKPQFAGWPMFSPSEFQPQLETDVEIPEEGGMDSALFGTIVATLNREDTGPDEEEPLPEGSNGEEPL